MAAGTAAVAHTAETTIARWRARSCRPSAASNSAWRCSIRSTTSASSGAEPSDSASAWRLLVASTARASAAAHSAVWSMPGQRAG